MNRAVVSKVIMKYGRQLKPKILIFMNNTQQLKLVKFTNR